MSFADVAAPAIRIAREGFPAHAFMAAFIRKNRAMIERFPSTAAIYLPGGRAPDMGDLFVQSDLAASLQYMADEERRRQGTGVRAGWRRRAPLFIAATSPPRSWPSTANRAVCSARAIWPISGSGSSRPVEGRFGDLTVWTCGPWCQGPMLLQTLNLLDPAALAAAGHNSPAAIHAITEAVKLAAADREAYYGDPRFVDVPICKPGQRRPIRPSAGG